MQVDCHHNGLSPFLVVTLPQAVFDKLPKITAYITNPEWIHSMLQKRPMDLPKRIRVQEVDDTEESSESRKRRKLN